RTQPRGGEPALELPGLSETVSSVQALLDMAGRRTAILESLSDQEEQVAALDGQLQALDRRMSETTAQVRKIESTQAQLASLIAEACTERTRIEETIRAVRDTGEELQSLVRTRAELRGQITADADEVQHLRRQLQTTIDELRNEVKKWSEELRRAHDGFGDQGLSYLVGELVKEAVAQESALKETGTAQQASLDGKAAELTRSFEELTSDTIQRLREKAGLIQATLTEEFRRRSRIAFAIQVGLLVLAAVLAYVAYASGRA
ncbi:hypothetical protein ACFL59_16345, partial [Planctomycetota bacterium]